MNGADTISHPATGPTASSYGTLRTSALGPQIGHFRYLRLLGHFVLYQYKHC